VTAQSTNGKFDVFCRANGRHSAAQTFRRIACGALPQFPNAGFTTLEEGGSGATKLLQNSTHKIVSRNKVASHKAAAKTQNAVSHLRFSRTGTLAFYGDVAKFECLKGYKVKQRDEATVRADDPSEFAMRCAQDGDLADHTPAPSQHAQGCVPVTCTVGQMAAGVSLSNRSAATGRNLVYQEKAYFSCNSSMSLNGKPSGAKEFSETCQDDGTITDSHTCSDIDWCTNSRCGDHGSCVDGLHGYTCSCDNGYEALAVADHPGEECVEINECNVQAGINSCASPRGNGGTCVDKVAHYECECADGFEMKKDINTQREQCLPKVCPAVPQVDNAATAQASSRITFAETVNYNCNSGYSLDGKADGEIAFSIECKADATYSSTRECKPVECGDLVEVENAKPNASSLVFGEHAVYECNDFHTLTGQAGALASFSVSCTALGALTENQSCSRITCGMTPTILKAQTAAREMFHDDTVTYHCNDGHSLNGHHDGEKSFDVKCNAGQHEGSQTCEAISCGSPSRPSHSQIPQEEVFFLGTAEGTCNLGYSTNGSITGDRTWVATCLATGEFDGMQECHPVSCGKPNSTAGANAEDKEYVYGESATFTCKDGFSTDGTPTGDTDFQKACDATGAFAASSPSDCEDINFCSGNPCTASGICTDLSTAPGGSNDPVLPGYKCDCMEGFEVIKRSDGKSETCKADDCAGDPCGEGGTCKDLSKDGGPQGKYECQCRQGYRLNITKDGETCKRVVCGALMSTVNFVKEEGGKPKVTVKTGEGKPPTTDPETGMHIMRSNDRATFECMEGYSTDGTLAPESKKFSVRCQASGQLDPPLNVEGECQPVRCDSAGLPNILHSSITTPPTAAYQFGDKVPMGCDTGYTTDGKVSGGKTWELDCRADGTFSEEYPSCSAIQCRVPTVANASSSAAGHVAYNTQVTWLCDTGFEAGSGSLNSQVTGTCSETGDFTFTGASTCTPRSCGRPPAQQDASYAHPEANHTNLTVADMPLVVRCSNGSSIGGSLLSPTEYTVSCNPVAEGSADAAFVSSAGQAVCSVILVDVAGEITKASMPSVVVAGATVRYTNKATGAVAAEGVTGPNGIYRVRIPRTLYEVTTSKYGFIDHHKDVDVATPIIVGQAGDIPLPAELPAGSWRAILTWNHGSVLDLYSTVSFGVELSKTVNFMFKKNFDAETMITVSQQKEDTRLETTTFSNLGNCVPTNRSNPCRIAFRVDFDHHNRFLKDSGAKVKVYAGNSKKAEYDVPQNLGTNTTWNVFEIDAQNETIARLF